MADDEPNYKQLYSDKFTRRIPFPKLAIETIKVNPIDPKYFYIIKKQQFDEDIQVKNIVADEDRQNIRDRIDVLESKIDDDYDSDQDEFLGDLFEKALDELRQEKIYSVDEEGQARTSLKLITRGTKTGGDSFGNKDNKNDGFMAAVRATQANNPIAEQSSEQEGTSYQQSSAVEGSGETGDSEEVTPSDSVEASDSVEPSDSAVEASGINASSYSDEEGGESEPDDSEEIEDSKDSASINASRNEPKGQDAPADREEDKGDVVVDVAVEETKKSEPKNDNVLSMAAKVISAQNVAEKLQQEKKLEEEKQKAQGKDAAKPEENKDAPPEEDEKDKEEPLTEEIVQFIEYPEVSNSGRVLKNKPYVLLC